MRTLPKQRTIKRKVSLFQLSVFLCLTVNLHNKECKVGFIDFETLWHMIGQFSSLNFTHWLKWSTQSY